jgi:hypothetical protein
MNATTPPPIQFRFAPVAPGLEQVALIYWEVNTTISEPVIDQLHPDYANMRFKLSGDWAYGSTRSRLVPVADFATVTGPTSQGQWASVEDGQGFNITLRPRAWLRLFEANAAQWHNRLRPLSDLVGSAEAEMLADEMARSTSFEHRVACANAWLLRLWQASEPHPREAELAAIEDALRDPACATVEELGRRARLPRAASSFLLINVFVL